MTVLSKKTQMICALMGLNIIVCIFLSLTWNSEQAKNFHPKIKIPTTPFWRPELISGPFWNREQQRLDFIHNHNFNFSNKKERSDWLNDGGSNACEPDFKVQTQIPDYNLLPKNFQDFLLYSRCRSYPMLLNQLKICKDPPFLLLVVKSLVPHFERRQAIRETWGKVGVVANRKVATVFLIGNTLPVDNAPDLIPLLRYEEKIHKDILQWDFRDTFFNLTLKDVLFLEWFSSFCPKAQFIFKGDDDVFVNTPRVITYLGSLSKKNASNLFSGDVIKNAGPHRNKKLKYYIPESFYEGGYPPYAGGGGLVYSGQIALRLNEVSKKVPLYPIDDVYTGMCLKKLGLEPEKHDGFRTFDIEVKYRDYPCIHRDLMVVHSRTPQQVKYFWPWMVQPELECQ